MPPRFDSRGRGPPMMGFDAPPIDRRAPGYYDRRSPPRMDYGPPPGPPMMPRGRERSPPGGMRMGGYDRWVNMKLTTTIYLLWRRFLLVELDTRNLFYTEDIQELRHITVAEVDLLRDISSQLVWLLQILVFSFLIYSTVHLRHVMTLLSSIGGTFWRICSFWLSLGIPSTRCKLT